MLDYRFGLFFAGVDTNTREVVEVFVSDAVHYTTAGRLARCAYPAVVWVVDGRNVRRHYVPNAVEVTGFCRCCWETVPEGYDGEPLLEEEPFPEGWEDVPCRFHRD